MTHVIKLSELCGTMPADFDAMVAKHVEELVVHRAHMKEVDAGRAKPYPGPRAHQMIELSIRDDGNTFVGDYRIEDDSAALAARSIEERKTALALDVTREEHALCETVLPTRKRRALSFRRQDVQDSDADRRNNILKTAVARNIKRTADEIDADVEAGRTTEQAGVVKEYEETNAAIIAITRHAAELHAQIEDLTVETIDNWTPAPFPARR